jgi:hypothetical protein
MYAMRQYLYNVQRVHITRKSITQFLHKQHSIHILYFNLMKLKYKAGTQYA